MMKIVTTEIYLEHNSALSGITQAELEAVLEAAVQVISYHTNDRIKDYDSFSAETRERICKAVCYEADYILANGGVDFLNGAMPESASIGSFSYSLGNSGNGEKTPIALCNISLTFLLPTGLCYRGDVNVC